MYLSSYFLEQLKLKKINLENLPENEQIHKIRLQWVLLCSRAKSDTDVAQYTRVYHALISPDDNTPSPFLRYHLDTHVIELPHVYFSFSQRGQIDDAYQELITEFSALETELDKQNFVTRHSAFINLAQALRRSRKEFEEFFASYLYCLYSKRLQPLKNRIIYQWRTAMIRLFAREGLDDFQYRNAEATGQLRPILENGKLYSPVKLFVALVNSLLIAISVSLNYFLDLHVFLRLGFNLLLFHPVAILLVQLPIIAQILEMLACPNNQIIRPLCDYTKLSPKTVTALLGLCGLLTTYGLLYTSLFASLMSLLPYVQLIMLGYFLYSMGKLFVPFFRESPLEAISFLLYLGLFIGLLVSLQGYLATTMGTGVGLQKDQSKQLLTVLRLYSFATILTTTQQDPLTEIEMLPAAHQAVPQSICEIVQTRYNKANLSHLFFNTLKDAEAIRSTVANNDFIYSYR